MPTTGAPGAPAGAGPPPKRIPPPACISVKRSFMKLANWSRLTWPEVTPFLAAHAANLAEASGSRWDLYSLIVMVDLPFAVRSKIMLAMALGSNPPPPMPPPGPPIPGRPKPPPPPGKPPPPPGGNWARLWEQQAIRAAKPREPVSLRMMTPSRRH